MKANGYPAPDPIKVAAIAYIDLETRLPLYVQFGDQKRSYQYGAPPQAPLTLPAGLTDALKAYLVHMQKLAAPVPKA